MKKYSFLLLTFLSFTGLSAQYHSAEREAYNNSPHYPAFAPIDKKVLLSFHPFGITVKEFKTHSPFKNIYYGNYDDKGVTDGIENYYIIKKAENAHMKAILYKGREYDEEMGIWIALLDKKYNKWHKYYTGLSENLPFALKPLSALPLIKNDSTLQIEAAILQQVNPRAYPISILHEFDLVKDGVAIEFDLKKITLDSDHDGLTDIVENKLMLDPYSMDTDKDGIPDAIDANPRFNEPSTDKTMIYESLIAPELRYPNIPDSAKTVLIVSNSKDILGIKNSDKRLIILTEQEYKSYKKRYPGTLFHIYYSPLFKVDGMEDTFLLYESTTPYSGSTYLVEKKGDTWIFRMMGGYIAVI